MRVESSKPLKNGGWFHQVGTAKRLIQVPKRPEPPKINATQMMREFSANTRSSQIDQLASQLGVSFSALIGIGTAWAKEYFAWAFPMKDAYGNTVGIRLRNEHGKKWAVTGSRAGLFYSSIKTGGMTCVCEGPTDTAAAITLGCQVCGRPSCQGQELLLCDRLKGSSRVLIISDNDESGWKGAERLQKMLKCPSLIWCPPCKDLREFLKMGGTHELIDTLTKSLIWTRPT